MEDNEKKSIFSKFKDITKNKKLALISAALIFVIILFLFFSSFKMGTQTSSTKTTTTKETSLYLEYVTKTENRLKNVLNSVKGINNVNVFLFVTESPKLTYLSETSNGKNNTSISSQVNTIILAKDGTTTYPIVVYEELPSIKGALIVASGVGDVKTKLEICNIVSSVLKVDVSSVEVLEGK